MRLYKDGNPRVSIILPTFNRFSCLSRAIESVLNQTFTSWELLVIDDGSTDDTFRLVDKFIRGNENIRYLKHSNKKLPFTLNTGILSACGEYIAFLGSDDEWKPDHLGIRMETFEEEPGVDLIHGGVEIIGDPFVTDKNDRTKKIHLNNCIIGGTFVGKRDLFLKLNGFENLEYSEDSEFFERALKIANIRKVNFETYIYYRNTINSITNNY